MTPDGKSLAGQRPADFKEPGQRPAGRHDDPTRRSPVLSSLGRFLPRAAASLAEMEGLRRRAWRQDGVLSLRDGDDRLTWPERELVRQLGDRLYGARYDVAAASERD